VLEDGRFYRQEVNDSERRWLCPLICELESQTQRVPAGLERPSRRVTLLPSGHPLRSRDQGRLAVHSLLRRVVPSAAQNLSMGSMDAGGALLRMLEIYFGALGDALVPIAGLGRARVDAGEEADRAPRWWSNGCRAWHGRADLRHVGQGAWSPVSIEMPDVLRLEEDGLHHIGRSCAARWLGVHQFSDSVERSVSGEGPNREHHWFCCRSCFLQLRLVDELKRVV
jgi:hypothetical protein